MSSCCFKRCRAGRRGSCCFIISKTMNSSHISVSMSHSDIIGSIYIRNTTARIDNMNDTFSYGSEATGLYLNNIIKKTETKFIGFHHLKTQSCIGLSEKADNGLFSKYVVTDCLECEYVFRLLFVDAEMNDVYLWKVPSKLRCPSGISYKLVIKSMFSDKKFDYDLDTITIENEKSLQNLPTAEPKNCFLCPRPSTKKSPSLKIISVSSLITSSKILY